MDPIVGGSLISAGAGLFGDLMGLGRQTALQREAWDREDTAVQRRVRDLRAAGLSPTLAAGSAAGSSAPINVMGAFQHAGERVGEAVRGGLELQAQKIGLRKLAAEAGRTEADRRRAEAEADIKESESYYLSTFGHMRQAAYLARDVRERDTTDINYLRKLIMDEEWPMAIARRKNTELALRLAQVAEKMGSGPAGGLGSWARALVPFLQIFMR